MGGAARGAAGRPGLRRATPLPHPGARSSRRRGPPGRRRPPCPSARRRPRPQPAGRVRRGAAVTGDGVGGGAGVGGWVGVARSGHPAGPTWRCPAFPGLVCAGGARAGAGWARGPGPLRPRPRARPQPNAPVGRWRRRRGRGGSDGGGALPLRRPAAGLAHSPAAHLARPRAGSDTPLGPVTGEVAALLTAAEADSPRAAALVCCGHTGLRVDEALSRDRRPRRREAGHEVLELRRKGGRDAVTVLPAPVVRALIDARRARRRAPCGSGDR